MWADQIRRDNVVRWVYGEAARSLIDQRDIADIAVLALTEPGHAGQRHVLTGPETITQIEQVRAIVDGIRTRAALGGDATGPATRRTHRDPLQRVGDLGLVPT
jgi:uncharacterized protein YbjT (DUF2867 family)